MRDPERIPVILSLLDNAWRRTPDMLLGQLLVAVLRNDGNLFDVEDEVTKRRLRAWAEQRWVASHPYLARGGSTGCVRHMPNADTLQ
jgi:hypothetical protein